VKYTPAGGSIAIAAERRDGVIRYSVTDNGPGVPPELRQAIFEKFFRRPGATTPGAGLGLFIAREIVEAHGGKIGVEGEPGTGSTFWFELPAAEE
jgi:signal transduction histidine kinase